MNSSTITIEAQLSYDKLLEAVGQLNVDDLDKLQSQITRRRASLRGASLPKQEAELLLKINRLLPPKKDTKYQELLAKRQKGALSEAEQQELLGLNDKYERQDAKRIKYLTQLAQLRGVSLTKLMDALEIPQPMYD